MIVFNDVVTPLAVKRRRTAATGAADPQMVEELQRCKDEIHALRQEMGASAEELQAANEELQTLNQELQTKLDDLALAQSDMQNLLNSTDIATLFLDGDLNVRRYTEQITRIISLREGDIGRPLIDLASTLNCPALNDDARQTLKTLTFTEKEITTTDGFWFLVRIKPYRTLSNVIQGVVITLIDISAAKKLESRLRKG
jgi:two-component system CheB/CheR fusion protein